MFNDFFYLLKEEGVPVSPTEWMTLMEGLSQGLAFSSLTGFYYLARACLVKSEAYYDSYDLAFQRYFGEINTPEEFVEQVLKWLESELSALETDPSAREGFRPWNLEELRRLLEDRLSRQDSKHQGGSHWIGTGGHSRLGHSGRNLAGLRISGESVNCTAVKVAGERRYKDFRQDEALDTRQFEVALRKLRQLTTREEGPKDILDLEETIAATCKSGGILKLEWTRPRKNEFKVALLMDSGGSMTPYLHIVKRLFTAVNKSSHFKDLRYYYFHNCIYERIFLNPICVPRDSVPTDELFKKLDSDYRIIIVGDASMSPGELTMKGGAIDWGVSKNEPGLYWLKQLARRFKFSVWLNPKPEREWSSTDGAETISIIRSFFPMYELTVEGLEKAIKKLKVRR
ncbi:vWA domain-containing protein [Desulfolucanica intricata]|uniref:vWA domain-containing protein n=1 Tax=Desulfolucanica intricata TaxID=1285191 RepID=UPI00082D4C29|nr:VWA domain-containing protein [Desulfolucanica intricata]